MSDSASSWHITAACGDPSPARAALTLLHLLHGHVCASVCKFAGSGMNTFYFSIRTAVSAESESPAAAARGQKMR